MATIDFVLDYIAVLFQIHFCTTYHFEKFPFQIFIKGISDF